LVMVTLHKRRLYKWWVLYTVAIGVFTVFLDGSVLVVCFPRLAEVFGVGPSVVVWINITYLIISQSLMLIFAKIGDAKGRKKVYLAGLACFALGLVICSVSRTIVHLLVGRAVQGMGTATVLSLSMAMAVAVFPTTERGKALGILASARSLGLMFGPVFGGFMLDLLGWRGIFYTRLPIILLGFAMAWVIIEEQEEVDGNSRFRLDLLGSGSFFCWLSGLLLFLSFGGKLGFSTPSALGLGMFTVVFFVIFLSVERRCTQPFIDLSLFGKPLFAAATVSAVLQGVTTIMIVSLTPFYLIDGLGYAASTAGLFLVASSAVSLFMAPISGRLSDRLGSRMLSTLGMSLICVAFYFLSRLGAHPTSLEIAAVLGLMGAGIGIFQPPNNSSIIGSVSKDNLGTASAIATTAMQLGVSAGFAIGGAVFGARQLVHSAALSSQGPATALIERMAVISSYSDTLIVAMAFAGAGIVTSLIRGTDQPRGTGQ
jgi:EmrB/QacA subfamily drug resistance transporter